MTFYEPLNLEHWLVDTFSGTYELFVIVAIFAITALCAKFKMNMAAYFAMLVLFSVVMMGVYGFKPIIVISILVGGPIFLHFMKKIPE